MSASLNLAQLTLPAPLLYGQSSAARNAGRDPGYLAHQLLTGLFGESAPKPFRVKELADRKVEILGYCDADEAGLREQAELFADPRLHGRLAERDALLLRPVPLAALTPGRRLGFEVLTYPVARKSGRAGPGGAEGWFKAGSEHDVFELAKERAGGHPDPDRETVYRKWFTQRLAETGGVALESLRLAGTRDVRLERRDGENKTRLVSGRSALFHGLFSISDSAAFIQMLRRGVGRHRAFGFGMFLIRPAILGTSGGFR